MKSTPRHQLIKNRIQSSLAIPRSKHGQAETREFWHGFLLACVEYTIVSSEEYRTLRDMVAGYPYHYGQPS